jgi:hypothetical protein
LCDLERVVPLFRDDFYLHNKLMRAAQKAKGEPIPETDFDDERLLKPGMVGSRWVLDRVNEFARQHDNRVL